MSSTREILRRSSDHRNIGVQPEPRIQLTGNRLPLDRLTRGASVRQTAALSRASELVCVNNWRRVTHAIKRPLSNSDTDLNHRESVTSPPMAEHVTVSRSGVYDRGRIAERRNSSGRFRRSTQQQRPSLRMYAPAEV